MWKRIRCLKVKRINIQIINCEKGMIAEVKRKRKRKQLAAVRKRWSAIYKLISKQLNWLFYSSIQLIIFVCIFIELLSKKFYPLLSFNLFITFRQRNIPYLLYLSPPLKLEIKAIIEDWPTPIAAFFFYSPKDFLRKLKKKKKR